MTCSLTLADLLKIVTIASFSVMKKIKPLTVFLLLSFTLIACAQTRVDAVQLAPQTTNDVKEILTLLAKLASRDSPTIDIKPLSFFAQTDFELHVKNNATIDGLVSVQQLIPSALNSGLVSVSYSKQYAPKAAVQYVESNKRIPSDLDTKYLERIGIIFNLLLLCVKAQDVQKAWETQFKDESFSKLGYGAGSLWPSDGIHKNLEEQKRFGNGPIEVVVNIKTPLDSAHKSVFRFTHDYWACARSFVLERRY
jgi:hypothetical protein